MQWFGLSEKEVSQIQQEIKIETKKKNSPPRKAGKKKTTSSLRILNR